MLLHLKHRIKILQCVGGCSVRGPYISHACYELNVRTSMFISFIRYRKTTHVSLGMDE
jgi:hypothetical protein